MEVCKVLLFAILEILLVHSVHLSKKIDNANWRKHTRRAAEFKCSVPQPRAFSFEDFMDTTKLPHNSNVLPPMTVLHRCDSQSGCCNHNEACGPIDFENVTLTFHIITILQDSKTNREFKTITARNHTECGCEAVHSRPK